MIKNIMVAYQYLVKARRKNLLFIHEENIEIVEETCSCVENDKQIEVNGYKKKNQKVFTRKCKLKDIAILLDEMINKFEMIVIIPENCERNDVLEMIRKYSCKNSCYAPIAFSERSDVLFFPKLRFEDSLLLKYILEKQFVNEEYCVAYANKTQLVAMD